MFDLATAKTRLNIVGTLQDAAVQASLDTAMALAERYCSRQFTYAAETASFYYPLSTTLQLSRYPLEQVVSIKSGSTNLVSTDYKASLGTGQILFSGYRGGDQIDVTYAGGYKTLPADLELALFSIFDAVWAAMPGAGAGAVSAGGQVINSITVPDVGTIRYESSGAGAGSSSASVGLIPAVSTAILDLYKLEVC